MPHAKTLGTLTEEETERLAFLEKRLLDQRANDRTKTAQTFTLRAARLCSLAQYLKNLDATLDQAAVDKAFEAQALAQTKQHESGQFVPPYAREATRFSAAANTARVWPASWTVGWAWSADRHEASSMGLYCSGRYPTGDLTSRFTHGAPCVAERQFLLGSLPGEGATMAAL